jgi:hypothetical protein
MAFIATTTIFLLDGHRLREVLWALLIMRAIAGYGIKLTGKYCPRNTLALFRAVGDAVQK